MEYKTFWISEKFNEKHCRIFDNESFALRHAEDMFCWGYDVTVKQEDGIILRKIHTIPKVTPNTKEFKSGDRVRIIDNTIGHEFNNGEIVILRVKSPTGTWKAEYLDSSEFWYVSERDIDYV